MARDLYPDYRQNENIDCICNLPDGNSGLAWRLDIWTWDDGSTNGCLSRPFAPGERVRWGNTDWCGASSQAGLPWVHQFRPPWWSRVNTQNAAEIILVHNHPSGDPSPSPEDINLTRAAVQAGKLLDIEVLDHIVIGRGEDRFVSLKKKELGF